LLEGTLRNSITKYILTAAATAVFCRQGQAQSLYGRNLVVNGDGEAGPATNGGNTLPSSIPGWTVSGGPNVVLYSANNRLTASNPGPANRGKAYFAGSNTAKAVLTQTIDVSAVGAAIDAGTVSLDASAYIGGESGDNSSVTFTFLGTGGTVLASLPFAPLTAADRPADTGIFFRRDLDLMPKGTRSVTVEVDLIRTSGINNTGCADNISFLLVDDSAPPAGFFGSNLIVNGNGEAPTGATLPVPLASLYRGGVPDVPSWVRTGAMMVDVYSPNSDLTASSASAPDRGSWYFYGGADSAVSTAVQDIDLAGAAAQIDTGKATFAFSGWVGGYEDQDDNMTVTAQFVNWSGTVLSQVTLGPVKAAERGNVSKLLEKSQSGAVPAGTRAARITLVATRVTGVDNDGMADSLSLVLTAPGAGGLPPSIQAGGVVSASAFGGSSAIAPGTWVEIYGSNLAGGSREWAGADFVGTTAPNSLDGTVVRIAGQQAFIRFISGGQVNAQIPSGVAPGPQSITVQTANGTSAAYPITVNAAQPGMLTPSSFAIGGTQYVAAQHADGTFVLPVGAIAGLSTKPAAPGETILMYGIGFGSVSPAVNAGQIVGVVNQLVSPLTISFAGAPAGISYDGLAPGFVGLYQFNVVVPNVSDSDHVPVSFSLGGAQGSQTMFTAVKR
jgi:uncharacterized protein (TIGR03437 family)